MNIKTQKKDNRTKLEKEIDCLIDEMATMDRDSKEYTTMVNNLETLLGAKGKDRDRRISPDTLAVIAGNLLGIGLILSYERLNVITSKALGFVVRGRV